MKTKTIVPVLMLMLLIFGNAATNAQTSLGAVVDSAVRFRQQSTGNVLKVVEFTFSSTLSLGTTVKSKSTTRLEVDQTTSKLGTTKFFLKTSAPQPWVKTEGKTVSGDASMTFTAKSNSTAISNTANTVDIMTLVLSNSAGIINLGVRNNTVSVVSRSFLGSNNDKGTEYTISGKTTDNKTIKMVITLHEYLIGG